MAWLEDLADHLVSEGVGTKGVNIFASSRVAVPVLAGGAATVHIQETGGSGPERVHNTTDGHPVYLNPTAQILVRANEYAAAMAKSRAAYNALAKVKNQTINSKFYKWIRPLQEPFDLGTDDRGQIRIVFNVTGNKRP